MSWLTKNNNGNFWIIEKKISKLTQVNQVESASDNFQLRKLNINGIFSALLISIRVLTIPYCPTF